MGTCAVSRLEFYKLPNHSPGAGYRIKEKGAYPGATTITNLSWVQERFAKTVTSNFPLLSVLATDFYLNISK
jgi:hypothetical protein